MVTEQIDELIKHFSGRSHALNARLALARELAEAIDDPEVAPYAKVGLARELNKILLIMPLS